MIKSDSSKSSCADAHLFICQTCGGQSAFVHEHKKDQSGLDDGPWLPHCRPRKKPRAKSRSEMKVIRAKAWATRRSKLAQNKKNCPHCGGPCHREVTDMGVGPLYGSWECSCGWSEDDERNQIGYSHR